MYLPSPLFIYFKNKEDRPNFGAKVDIKIETVKFTGKDPTLLNPSPTSIRNAHKIIEITVPY